MMSNKKYIVLFYGTDEAEIYDSYEDAKYHANTDRRGFNYGRKGYAIFEATEVFQETKEYVKKEFKNVLS